jgi:hypothetical protein
MYLYIPNNTKLNSCLKIYICIEIQNVFKNQCIKKDSESLMCLNFIEDSYFSG